MGTGKQCSKCDGQMTLRKLSGVFVCETCGHVEADADAAAQVDAVEAAKIALRFYANEANYDGEMVVLADRGSLAREALALLG